MRYPDVIINSIGDMLIALHDQWRVGEIVWFRGHSRADWHLVPSLARKAAHLNAESALLKRFMQNAVPHLDRLPTAEWEWMFLMQHHRAPTRLLDWSESPLAALYFAVSEARDQKREGALWCVDPIALNRDVAKINFSFSNEIPAFSLDTVLENYLPSRVTDAKSIMTPVAIVGPRNTARMAAQLGVFTINHRDHTAIEALGAGHHIWRWIITAARKKSLLADLKLLGITALSLFPELDRVADVSKELLT